LYFDNKKTLFLILLVFILVVVLSNVVSAECLIDGAQQILDIDHDGYTITKYLEYANDGGCRASGSEFVSATAQCPPNTKAVSGRCWQCQTFDSGGTTTFTIEETGEDFQKCEGGGVAKQKEEHVILLRSTPRLHV